MHHIAPQIAQRVCFGKVYAGVSSTKQISNGFSVFGLEFSNLNLDSKPEFRDVALVVIFFIRA